MKAVLKVWLSTKALVEGGGLMVSVLASRSSAGVGFVRSLVGDIKLCSWAKLITLRRLVSSVGRAPDCCAGGRGFEPQTGPTLRVLK